MGAMAAVFDRKGEKAPSIVLKMLEELKHRATSTPMIGTHPAIYVSQAVAASEDQEQRSVVAVGSNNFEPVLGGDFTWVFEGRLFSPTPTIMGKIKHEMGQQPLRISKRILKETEGSYAFGLAFPEKIVVARDPLGTKPLYYGENEYVFATATERKALWKVGVKNVHSFPPGNLAIVTKSGFSFEPVSGIKNWRDSSERLTMKQASQRLQKLLSKSVRKRVADVREAAVAFSGGLDSSIVAWLARLAGIEVHLFCVGLVGQVEIDTARKAAEILDLPLSVRTYTDADVKETLLRVLWLIEEPDAMKASVGMPFFWVAENASNLKHNVLLAGQGADELFGGYKRYLSVLETGGAKKLEERLYLDFVTSYETNFQRDEPVCAFHKVDLRLPFVDSEVARFSLGLPASLRIESIRDNLRKRVLREVARNLGIPSFISERPKRAVQFSTGVDKSLRVLAGNEGLTRRSYVERVFRQVYPETEFWKS